MGLRQVSSKVRHVDFSPDEYISGVGNVLRADEQGVYWMVCSLIMSEGGPIDLNYRRLASLCMIRPSDVERILNKLSDLGKITVGDGQIGQKRSQTEVERAANRIRTASENGSKGGRPRKIVEGNQHNQKADGFPVEKLTTNEQRATVEEEVISKDIPSRRKPQKRHAYSDEFEMFWNSYPTDSLMSKAEAGKAFDKRSAEDKASIIESLSSFKAYCSAHADYRPVHAVRYITQGRWEGFVKSAKKSAERAFVEEGTETWMAIRAYRGGAPLMASSKTGKSGWWFDRTEIKAAMNGHDFAGQ